MLKVKTGAWVALVSWLVLGATASAHAGDTSWAFPVGSAESADGWYVTIGLGDSWTSSSGISYRGHLAEDWFKRAGSSLGEPVYAASSGTIVVLRENCGSYLDVVVIEHDIAGEAVYSLYGHVEADGYVVAGQTVDQGQQIGVIGQPVVFFPHLHFSIFNRTAFVQGPHSNCTLSGGRYIASGYSGVSNDYASSLDYYDPSNDGIADNTFYHPSRFIENHRASPPVGDNVARGATNWLASSVFSSAFGGAEAFDGTIGSESKWTSDGSSAESWLAVDLGSSYDVNGFIVRHAGAAGEASYVNTGAFRIEHGEGLNGPWTTLASVTNAAQDNVSVTTLSQVVALRFVRLYVTDAGADDYARIVELEVYGEATPPPPPPDAENVALGAVGFAASSAFSADFSGDKAYDGIVSPDSKWTSDGTSEESWLALDLGASYDVESFIVRHAGAGGEESFYNTAAYQLESASSLSGPWASLVSVSNTSGDNDTTSVLAAPVTTRFIRLFITDAGTDRYARIPELEVYGTLAPPPEPAINVALGAIGFAASSVFSADYSGDKAYDGVASPDSKWTSDGATEVSWLALDLGASYEVESFIVHHAGAGGEESFYNTAAFRLESASSLSGPWESLVSVSNTSGENATTSVLATPVTTRFIRLFITDAGTDRYARIPEIETYGRLAP